MNRSILGVLCAGLCCGVGAQAAERQTVSDLPDWLGARIDPVHTSLTRWVDDTSRSIDGFFGTNDSLTVENRSYLRISEELEWQESESFSNDFNLRFRLDVPTTRQRLRLIIESDPEEAQGTLSEQGANRLRSDLRDRRSSVLGLEQRGRTDKRIGWENRFTGGVKFRFPLDPFLRFTSERLWALGEGPWELSSYNRLSWFDSDGYSARSRWDVGRPLDEVHHLRFVTQFQWQEEFDKLEVSQSAEINRILDSRSAIRYSAVAVAQSLSSPRVEDYYLQALYRRDIHRGFVFADVIPELHFPRESNFDPRWALTLRLEMYFRGDVVWQN